MIPLDRLAFVDVETTGLSPATDRIVEIGVVTVSGGAVAEWGTLVDPGKQLSKQSSLLSRTGQTGVAIPSFKEIAADLRARLAGRLFVAHNARFDFAFLKAEFQRVGMDFSPRVICSLMLSRRLYPSSSGHDLDTLMRRHGLKEEVRHRALPDARLVWQFWQAVQAEHRSEFVDAQIALLLADPVLPAHLDPSIIDRLPEAPGIYALYGENKTVLHLAKASNLRLHVCSYFRMDQISRKGLLTSHLVRNITWRVTRGIIGAHLHLKLLSKAAVPSGKRLVPASSYTWRFRPEAYPCLDLVPLSGASATDTECHGVFGSERKARNALRRLAVQRDLCQALLGIPERESLTCTGCRPEEVSHCARRTERLKHLARAAVALAPLRLAAWPYRGPVGVRERSDIHVFDKWCFLGTGQSEADVNEILETSRRNFDQSIYTFLLKTLPRLPKKRIVRLDCGTTPTGKERPRGEEMWLAAHDN